MGSYRLRGEFRHLAAHSNEHSPDARRPNEIHPRYRLDGDQGTIHSRPHPRIRPACPLEGSSNYFLSAKQMDGARLEAIAARGILSASRQLSSF
jgi:hypothetical protein